MNNNEGTTWWAMGLDNSQFEGDVSKSNALFRSIGNTADNEGSRIDSIFRKLTVTAASFFTAQQALSYANKIATVRGEFQQLEVAFNTMLGSKQKADALMAQVVDTAAKTPFDLQGVASGAKQLLAYGVASEDVTKRLTQLGDIAAGLSIPLNDIVYLYGTTMVQGRLFTQDVRQFMGRGIPLVKELSKELGKTEEEINAMVTAGEIGFPQVQKVLDNLTNSGGMFSNLMEAQSKTISGQISNLGDSISTMLNDIGKSQEGIINSTLGDAAYMVEHYQDVGRALAELIVTYGAYKAIIITVAATQQAMAAVRAGAEAQALEKLLSSEQQAVISKRNLVRGSAEYVTAVKAEITTNTEALQASLSKARVEVSAASQTLAARRAEYVASKELVVARTQELIAAQATGKSRTIESAQRKLAAAETAKETAAIQFQSSSRDFHTKKIAVESAAKAVNTTSTAVNTASQAANLSVTNLLTLAKTRLAVVAAKLNAVIMANGWTIAIAAVAALAYGIYKLITYQTDAEKAQSKLNDTIDESNRSIESERIQIDAMFARMKAAKKGTEEYKAAKDAIQSKYGDYLKSLGDEKTALDDLAKAYKIVTQEAEKAARARAMETATKDASDTYAEKKGDVRNEVKDLLDKKLKGQKGSDGISLSETYFWKIEPVLEGKAEITKEIQDIVSKFDESKYMPGDPMTGIGSYTYVANSLKDEITKTQKAKKIFEDTMNEARIQFGENPNDNKSNNKGYEVFYTKGKSIAELESAITKGKEKLDVYNKALKDNNGLTDDGKKVTDQTIKAQESYVATLKKTVLERENDLKIIREVEERIDKLKSEQKETVKGSSEYNDLQKRIDSLTKKIPDKKTSTPKEEKDYSFDLNKDAQEQIRLEKDLAFPIRKAKLDSQKESLAKTLDQNQLDYEMEIEQLRRQQEDKLNKIQEWEKTVWESQNQDKKKRGKFTPKTTELTEEEKKQYKELEKSASDKLVLNNKNALDELVKEYQTYAEKRKAIEEKYQKDIDIMQSANDKSVKAGGSFIFSNENFSILDKQKEDAIAELDSEVASREASFNVWADKIASMGLKQLKSALQTAKDTLNNDGNKLSEKEKSVLNTKIKVLEKQVETTEAKDSSLTSSEKSKKKWGDTLKVMNEVQETVNNIISDFDGLDDVTKIALTSATNIAGGIIGMISGIQTLAIQGTKAVEGVERASVILAIVGAAVQVLTAIFSLSSKAEKEHQEALAAIAESKLEMQRQYNLLLMEQNLLLKEATSIFGEEEIAKAANAINVYREAIAAYKDELKGEAPTKSWIEKFFGDPTGSYKKRLDDYTNGIGALSNLTIRTGSYTTGTWFWKKQHDIMTPVLEVYKDLVDEEGNLNVERAKAIIDTQTMSDENKKLLQSLIDLQEEAETAQEQLRDYLENTFGSLGEDIMTSISDAIENDGVSAWEKFGEAGSTVLEDLGKQIAYSLFFSDKFKKLQSDLEKIYGSGKTEEDIAKDARDLVSTFYNSIGTDMQNAQNWMQQWKEEANKQGFSLWESTREGATKGITTASQETVDDLTGRATVIQGHTYMISEGMKDLTKSMGQVLNYLFGIKENTDKLDTINSNIKEVKVGIETIVTKGIDIKR